MCSRNQDAEGSPGKIGKEMPKLSAFIVCQDREPGERAADTAVKCGGNSPYTASPSAQLLLLVRRIFLQTVGRIRDDGVN